jgi:hypothetical protein
MNLLTVDEKIQSLKNLFSNPDNSINSDFSSLSDDDPETYNGPIGINEWSPEANKSSKKPV